LRNKPPFAAPAHDQRRQAQRRFVEHQQSGLGHQRPPYGSICRSPPERVEAVCARRSSSRKQGKHFLHACA
jgi:hypothetical protein